VLRRIFRPKRDEVTGMWRKLHDEELTDLYCSPNIVRVIKSITTETGRACSTYGGEERRIQDFGGKPYGKRHLEDPGVDGRIILIWIFRK